MVNEAHRKLVLVASVLAAAMRASISFASEPPSAGAEVVSPKGHIYAVALVATTLAYRPPGGPFEGPLGDIGPAVGAGYFLSDMIALELDVGPTFIDGEYALFSVIPAVIWAFHPNIYAAGRFMVPLDPEVNLIVIPAIGGTYTFKSGLAPFVELELASAVGRGDPDFGVAIAMGATYLF